MEISGSTVKFLIGEDIYILRVDLNPRRGLVEWCGSEGLQCYQASDGQYGGQNQPFSFCRYLIVETKIKSVVLQMRFESSRLHRTREVGVFSDQL